MDRSVLYNLEPIGIGTPYVESLTSYITRLAAAHCVLTGNLISRIYAPYLKKEYLTKISIRGGGFYETAIGINGVGYLAKEFSQLTNKLTCRSDVSYTTLERVSAILPTRGVLKKTKSWCPHCYEEAKLNNEIIFDPLIWNFQLVKYCLKHRTPLENECANCHSLVPVIDRESSPGFCSRCGSWMGVATTYGNNTVGNESITDNTLIGELLAHNEVDLSYASFPESLNFYVNEFFSQTSSKAATYFNIPYSTFMTWISGKARPNVHYLIHMCKLLSISIIGFFQKEKPVMGKSTTESLGMGRNRYDQQEITKTLKKIIKDKEPVSISEVARMVGCDRKLISRMYKTECNEIKKNYNAFLQKNKEERLFSKINQLNEVFYLLIKQGIYPSRRRLEELLGTGFLKEKTLQNHWIELKRELSV